MEQIIDDKYWRQGSLRPQVEGATSHPDWNGLHVRLVAAHEAWIAMASARAGDLAGAQGSFSGNAARLLSGGGVPKEPVNLVDSANLNCGERISEDVAGQSRTGVRG